MPEQDWTFYCDFSGFETTSVFSDSVTQQLVWFDDSRVRRGTEPAWNWHLRIAEWADTYLPWLLTAGPFHLSRSMQSDVGNFVLQNMSGTSLERDMNKLITASAFEGALFAFREWNLDAQKPEFEMHGHLSITRVTEQVAEFMGEQLFNPSDYQAVDLVAETCRWRYGSTACGDTSVPRFGLATMTNVPVVIDYCMVFSERHLSRQPAWIPAW